MFIPVVGRQNWLGYFFWKWIYRANGLRSVKLDQYFFGPSHGVNDYDTLASSYKKSNVKPDKVYSILPTVLKMVGNCRGKTCTDVGCGGGFFSLALAHHGASQVYGLDNSRGQLTIATQFASHPRIVYVLRDVFVQKIMPTDVVVAAFVANYARSKSILSYFFRHLYDGLKEGGKVILVVDLQNGKELKRFGAIKRIDGEAQDEASIRITLYNDNAPICNLDAFYYTPPTIESALLKAGFREISWQKPVVSEEGITALGEEFWKGYTDDPELGYIMAKK
jgi:toxoflavin synthase